MVERQANGMLPYDTPIMDLGLNAREVGLLTSSAKQLTKQDLLILNETATQFRSGGEEKVVQIFDQRIGKELRVGDIASVQSAFNAMAARRNAVPEAAAGAACCCCTCCPCCSCTASVVIEAIQ